MWRGELVNRRKDGSLYFEDMTITPIRGGGGEPTSFIAVKQDITERKRAETELRESEERYRTLVDNLEDVVFGIDAAGKVTFVNAAIGTFGYRPEDVLGRGADDLLHEDDRALFHGMWAAPDGTPARELRIVDAQGKVRPVRMRLRPYRLGSRAAGASAVAVDLTARRETEEQLRASQKMEAVGRLAGGVAHDFNNLLSVILSYSGLAVEELHEEDPLRADLLEVVEAGRRAEALTRQLLAFSRKQLLAPEALDLNDLVRKVSRMLERLIGEDVELVVDGAADIPRTRVDRGQMEQVLLNLAVNARDAMPEGGRLGITTRAVVLDGARAEALELSPGKYVELAVSDTGQGMAERVRTQVFEPFFTTKGPGKGTGLGLSMVFGIVRQSGGAISVESEEGKGSTFRIHLPEHAGPAAPALARETSRGPERGNECVLVVEDEPALGAVVKRVLTSAGYEVLLASGAVEALGLAEKEGHRIRLILTDVIMPVMSGRELATRLVPLCPGARVVFMSVYTDEAIERFGVLDAEFLRKPFDLRILTERVRSVLDAAR